MDSDKPRILIVEDHPETRIMLDLALESTFEVVAYEGATELLDEAVDQHFDACLFDISLRDEIDGLELMQRLRQLPNFEHTPMIAMTALTWDNAGNQLFEKGFDRLVKKPFDPMRLVDMLLKLSRRGRDDVQTVLQAQPIVDDSRHERDKR